MLQEEARKVFGGNGAVSNGDIMTIDKFIEKYGINFRDSRVSCVWFNYIKLCLLYV